MKLIKLTIIGILLSSSVKAEVIQMSNGNFLSKNPGIKQYNEDRVQAEAQAEAKARAEAESQAQNVKNGFNVQGGAQFVSLDAGTEQYIGSGLQIDAEPQASETVINAVNAIARQYAKHEGVKAAGLSERQFIAIFRANIWTESAYKINARSHVGAIGLGQLMPATARRFNVNPNDAMDNLRGSAIYLTLLLSMFRDPKLALAGYNAGENAVVKHGGIPPYRETRNHVERVLTRANLLLRSSVI